MVKYTRNLRNFKKGLRLVENITKQKDERQVTFACGFCVASVKEMKKHGRITRNQLKALEDLAFEAADDTIAELSNEESANLEVYDFDALEE